jgi:hypothetical protein
MIGERKINFLQPESLTIDTALSSDEVRKKLLEVTSLNSTQYRADKMFRGEIKTSSFEIYRMFKGHNSFAAIVKGEIYQDPNGYGSTVKIIIDSPSSIKIVGIILSIQGFLVVPIIVFGAIFSGDLFIISIVICLGCFFYFLAQAFKNERAWAKREVQQLLH